MSAVLIDEILRMAKLGWILEKLGKNFRQYLNINNPKQHKIIVESTKDDPTSTFYVGGSADDAHQRHDGQYFDVTKTENTMMSHTNDNYRRGVGLRFPIVTVPQGVTVLAAKLSVYVARDTADDVNVVVYGEYIADSPQFADEAGKRIWDRTVTSASVSWVEDSLGVGWVEKTGLQGVVEEVVGIAEWSSGNALTLLLLGPLAATKQLNIYSYDKSSDYAAKLEVTWTSGGQTYEINVDAVVKASAVHSEKCTFNVEKDASVTSQVLRVSETTFNIPKDAIVKSLVALSFELGVPVEAIVNASAISDLESTFNISKEAVIQALATKILQATYNIHKDASVAGTAAHGEESTFTIPKDALVKALTDLSFELGISTEAIVKASATPNFELGFPVEAVVKASAAPDLESTFIIRKDVLVQALASVIVEKVAGAVIEIFKDAVVNAQATFSLESTFNISKDAVSKATATVNTETIFNVVKDAIIKASASRQVLGVYPINVDALVKASATPSLHQTLGISKDAVVVTVSTPLIQSTFNISKDAVVKVLAEVSVEKEVVEVVRLFLILSLQHSTLNLALSHGSIDLNLETPYIIELRVD